MNNNNNNNNLKDATNMIGALISLAIVCAIIYGFAYILGFLAH